SRARTRSRSTARSWAPPIRGKLPPARSAANGGKTSRRTPSTAPTVPIPLRQKSNFSLRRTKSTRLNSVEAARRGEAMKPNVKDLSREELEIWLSERGESRYRVDQIRRWLFQKGAASFAEMTNLSAKLRRELEGGFAISRLRVARSDRSAD